MASAQDGPKVKAAAMITRPQSEGPSVVPCGSFCGDHACRKRLSMGSEMPSQKKSRIEWRCPEATTQKISESCSFPSKALPAIASSKEQALPAPAPAPSQKLLERFPVSEKVLGTGQFGTVRECTDRLTGETLACKTINLIPRTADVIADVNNDVIISDTEEELRNEVELMMRLSTRHEGVVQLRGVIEEEGQVHLVMDLCQGGELFAEIMKRKRFSERDAAVLFLEIAQAVAFCHARGVMHRDLKPENVLLTRKLPEGVPLFKLASQGPLIKLADFGLATSAAPGQRLTGVVGSPYYVAPEVLRGEYDTKADVWSLGVILYILLTGSPPFWGDTNTEVFESILNDQLEFDTYPWGRISLEAKSLVRCCLNKDPARRPSAEKVLTHPWFARQVGMGMGIGPLGQAVGAESLAVRGALSVA